jgi:hypothetical protein
MSTLRRYLVLVVLMFWLGGFTFYVSVVVPIGTKVLGSPLRQGMITRQVTLCLNLAGAASLVPLGWDTLVGRDPAAWRFRTRAGLWLFVAACQIGLFALHGYLDAMIDVDAQDIRDPELFTHGHRLYLWLHTMQWTAMLVYMGLMLQSWRVEDRQG